MPGAPSVVLYCAGGDEAVGDGQGEEGDFGESGGKGEARL